jgi:hypothetical protein
LDQGADLNRAFSNEWGAGEQAPIAAVLGLRLTGNGRIRDRC